MKLSINLDEISSDLRTSLDFCKKNSMEYVEVRTVNNKNLVNFDIGEVRELYKQINSLGMHISGIASPLFKWLPVGYENAEPRYSIDTFGVPIKLTKDEKKSMIDLTINYATELNTHCIRIFSSLKINGVNKLPDQEMELLEYAAKKASKAEVELLIENEPVAMVYGFDEYINFLKSVGQFGIGAWFDIANFYESGRRVFREDFEICKEHIKYIHIKDPTSLGMHKFVPVGDGYINHKRIISDLLSVVDSSVFMSVETHAKINKEYCTQKSLDTLKKLLDNKRKKVLIVGNFDAALDQFKILSTDPTVEIRGTLSGNPEDSNLLSLITDTLNMANTAEVTSEHFDIVYVQKGYNYKDILKRFLGENVIEYE